MLLTSYVFYVFPIVGLCVLVGCPCPASGAILGMQAELGFRGPNYAVNTACATSNYAFINAAMHIRAGQADLILAGGTEAAVTPMGLGGFIACRALSARNDAPAAASRPWDKGRDGFVMGEARCLVNLTMLSGTY